MFAPTREENQPDYTDSRTPWKKGLLYNLDAVLTELSALYCVCVYEDLCLGIL